MSPIIFPSPDRIPLNIFLGRKRILISKSKNYLPLLLHWIADAFRLQIRLEPVTNGHNKGGEIYILNQPPFASFCVLSLFLALEERIRLSLSHSRVSTLFALRPQL